MKSISVMSALNNTNVKSCIEEENIYPLFRLKNDRTLLYGAERMKLFDVEDIKSINCDEVILDDYCCDKIEIERVNGDVVNIVINGGIVCKMYICLRNGKSEVSPTFDDYFKAYRQEKEIINKIAQTMLDVICEYDTVPKDMRQHMLEVLKEVFLNYMEKTWSKKLLFTYCDLVLWEDIDDVIFNKESAFELLKLYHAEEDYIMYFMENVDMLADVETLVYKIHLLNSLIT